MKKPPCLRPGCGLPPLNRGLCQACYQTVLLLVRRSLTTWEKLVKQGKALPPRHRCRRGEISAWVLGKKFIPTKGEKK